MTKEGERKHDMKEEKSDKDVENHLNQPTTSKQHIWLHGIVFYLSH